MRLIVQKYGGTSVGTPERIRAVAQRLLDTQRDNCRVVAAISAMAGVTDNLIKLAQRFRRIRRSVKWIFSSPRASTAASALTAMAVNALGGQRDLVHRRASRNPDRSRSHQSEDREHHVRGRFMNCWRMITS